MVRKAVLYFFLASYILAGSVGSSYSAGPAAGESKKPGLVVLESSANRLLVELETDLMVEEVEVGGEHYTRLVSSGLQSDAASRNGAVLPSTGFIVGLPPYGAFTVGLISVDSRIIELNYPIEEPAAAQAGQPFNPLAGLEYDSIGEVDRADDRGPAADLIQVGEPDRIRGLRVVSIQLNPFRYNPKAPAVEHVYRMVLEVRFNPGRTSRPLSDSWDGVLEANVINYDAAKNWQVDSSESRSATSINPPAQTPGSLKVEVSDDGLIGLDYGELAQAGFDVTSDPRSWQLTLLGEPVAILVEGEDDGSFDPGDRILFYGRAPQSRFTGTNVYWLAGAEGPVSRMETRKVEPAAFPITDTFRAAVRLEENHLYDPIHAEPGGDHWYWTDLRELSESCPQAAQQYEFSLSDLAASSGITATLQVNVQGYSEGTHNLTFKINGNLAGQGIWQDHDWLDERFAFDASWLNEGVNQLALENGDCDPGGSPNGMAFNFYSLDYWADLTATGGALEFQGREGDWQYRVSGLDGDLLLLDTSSPNVPILLTGWEWGSKLTFQDSASSARNYLAVDSGAIQSAVVRLDEPSDLLALADGANYVLVGYGDFLPATVPLIELRESQGWNTVSVDVEDVYDEFNYGLADPAALWLFFAAVDPIPDVVLLVGDGSIDYKDNLGSGWRNFIPVFPADVDPWWVETAADNRYACLDGYNTDPLPDFHIGRLAVSTLAETESVVKKIVGYETGRTGNPWGQHVLLVSDNNDQAGNFTAISDEMYQAYLQAGYEGDRVYLVQGAEEPYEYEPAGAGLAAARSALQAYWNQGQLLVSFTGHSSQSQWAYENLFHRDDIADLTNKSHLPVVLSLTCYVNSFQIPQYPPLGEQLLLEPTGGAVASWGPTGGGLSTGHRTLGLGFIGAITGPNLATLGEATLNGKLAVYGSGSQVRYLIDTYVLFGDPAMALSGGEMGSIVYLPAVQRQ